MLILKSLLFTFYYSKASYRNYMPIFLLILFCFFNAEFYLEIIKEYIIDSNKIFLITLIYILFKIFTAPIDINVFRSILKNKPAENYYFYFYLENNMKNVNFYLLKSLFLYSFIFVGQYITLFISYPFIVNMQTVIELGIIYLLVGFVNLYIYTRLIFVLPLSALNKDNTFAYSYNLTKGHSLKICVYIFLYYSIFYLVIGFLGIFLTNFFESRLLIFIFASVSLIFHTILSSALPAFICKEILGNLDSTSN